ncbi:MAG: glycosyltransferase [Oleispira sp.]|nr:glycosyltransferase [Oleispira sp.]MBL4882538.1 glycosyltransferase [Oleispira sp.]
MSDTSGKHFIIGVPTFNRAHLIPRILSSVQEQNYTNWTLLFVDDFSIDDTTSVISAFSDSNPKIQYRKMNQNSGVNAVRNRIIDEAKAIDSKAFLLFIDDDDYLAPESLALADEQITEHGEFSWFSLNCHRQDGSKLSRVAEYGALSYLNDYMFGKKIKGDLTHILKLESLGDERFTSEFKNGEEWYFWVNLSLTHDMYAIDGLGSIKEYLKGGLTAEGINKDKAIQVLKFKIDTLEPIVGKKKMLHQYVSLAKHYLAKKDFLAAKVALSEVFKSSPFYFRQYKHWAVLYLSK